MQKIGQKKQQGRKVGAAVGIFLLLIGIFTWGICWMINDKTIPEGFFSEGDVAIPGKKLLMAVLGGEPVDFTEEEVGLLLTRYWSVHPLNEDVRVDEVLLSSNASDEIAFCIRFTAGQVQRKLTGVAELKSLEKENTVDSLSLSVRSLKIGKLPIPEKLWRGWVEKQGDALPYNKESGVFQINLSGMELSVRQCTWRNGGIHLQMESLLQTAKEEWLARMNLPKNSILSRMVQSLLNQIVQQIEANAANFPEILDQTERVLAGTPLEDSGMQIITAVREKAEKSLKEFGLSYEEVFNAS